MNARRTWGRIAVAAAVIAVAFGTGADWLMVGAAVLTGWTIAVSAYRAARMRLVSIDLLVLVAAIGAIVLRNYWEAAAVTFLFALGKALEAATMARTRRALSELVEAAPDVATVERDGELITVPTQELTVGDVVVVRNGEQIPVDGLVISGHGGVDEATITGESMPVDKSALEVDGPAHHDDASKHVYAGTWLRSGLLRVRAERIGEDSTLASIIHRVEDAQDDKARTQTFLEKFSQYYTPGVIVGALVAGLFTRNLELALTLLVIACPGALVISIPVSVVAGIGRSAKDGVLIKGGEYLETAARVNTLVVDKTGTLTAGRPVLTSVIALDPDSEWDEREVLRVAAIAETGSEHPLGQAIVRGAQTRGIDVPAVQWAEPQVGRGIRAVVDGHEVIVGNMELLEQSVVALTPAALQPALQPVLTAASASAASATNETPEKCWGSPEKPGNPSTKSGSRLADAAALDASVGVGVDREAIRGALADLQSRGQTAMVVGVDGQPVGIIAVADEIRADAYPLATRLAKRGITLVMATGDAPAIAHAVAKELAITEVRAGLLPEDKLELVRELQAAGRTVAMLGDGVNDTPALALADVGVAMGAAGSPAAVETADIALMADKLSRLPHAFDLAYRTVRTMRVNIAIALVTVALLVAGVFAGGVTMALGMLVHEASVLVVIAIAMLLLRPTSSPTSPISPTYLTSPSSSASPYASPYASPAKMV